MARRKKVTYTETANKDNLNYSGTIYVKVLKGKKVYSSAVYKNQGRWPLFRFFSLCLAGQYNQASSLQPKFIDLFYLDGVVPEISDNSGVNLSSYLTAENRITVTSYPWTSLPYVSDSPDESSEALPEGSSSIRYKFLIPFTQLNITQENPKINALALYSDTYLNQFEKPSAFFFVRDKDDETVFGDLLDGVSFLNNASDEYNLSVEWELTISN